MKLGFRFLRNQRIDLNDGVDYAASIPVKIVEKVVPGIISAQGRVALVSVFDIGPESKIHYVDLLEENPTLPNDFASLSEGMKRAVEDKCNAQALDNREKNRAVREALDYYASTGVVQIVEEVAA